MARKELTLALGLMAVACPVAAQPDTQPIALEAAAVAPPGTPATRYCMKVDPVTGSLLETTECWTRAQWAEQGVDVDREWAKEGVRVIEA